MANDDVWRASNAATWWLGLLAGIVLLAAGVGVAALLLADGAEAIAVLITIAALAAMALVLAQGSFANRAAKRRIGDD